MPRSTSLAFRNAIFSQETDKVFILLCTISHVSLVTPIRLARSSVDVVSGGLTYTAFGLNVVIPADLDDGSVKSTTLTADGVDLSIIQALRSIPAPAPDITLAVVLLDTPDTVEWGPVPFKAGPATYDAQAVAWTLTRDDRLQNKWEGLTFNPIDAPGVF